MPVWRLLLIASCILLSLFFLLPGQDATQPTIKVTTHLVQINVIAHKKGEPVGDLKKEDFSIFDKGKEQKIAFFSVDSIDTPVKNIAPLPPNIFSNRTQRTDTPTSITVILFDSLNTRIQDQQYARRQVSKFLEDIKPQDRVALYALGRTVRVLHDFTNHPARLKRIIDRYRGVIPTGVPDPDESATDQDDVFGASDRAYSDFMTLDRARVTFDAMEAIAHHMAALPGRKNLVWVSSSFPFSLGMEPEDFAPGNTGQHLTFNEDAARVGRAMNDANVAIYPVDARGLVGMPTGFSAANSRNPSAPTMSSRAPGARPPIPKALNMSPPNLDTMMALADRTGGHAYYNTNDLAHAIRNAIDDARITYTLGFYPNSDEWDGKFHELKVKVGRSGVELRYRKGFVAFNQQAPSGKELSSELKNTVTSPLDATGVGINVRIDPTDKPQPGSRQILIQIDQDDITLSPAEQDKWNGRVELALIQASADGQVLKANNRTLDLNITKEGYENIRKNGLLVNQIVQPLPNAQMLRVVALDHPTGNIGSISVPLK